MAKQPKVVRGVYSAVRDVLLDALCGEPETTGDR